MIEMEQQILSVKTAGRGMVNITSCIVDHVKNSKIKTGLCHIFLHHTSASLILCENTDPTVQTDLEAFMQRLVPDGDELFEHVAEGSDDMPSHVRSILTKNDLSIPVTENKLNLGTWQGVYVWEHRLSAHERTVTVTLFGLR